MAAAAAARVSIDQVWWDMPAAIAYQLAFAWWQAQGESYVVDDRLKIRAALCRPK